MYGLSVSMVCDFCKDKNLCFLVLECCRCILPSDVDKSVLYQHLYPDKSAITHYFYPDKSAITHYFYPDKSVDNDEKLYLCVNY